MIPDEFKGFAEFRQMAFDHPTWLPTLIVEVKAYNSVYGKQERHDKRVVYFLQRGEDGPIKIGVSLNLKRRISELQTTSSEPLRLLGTVRGGYDLESNLHYELDEHRVHGEWFKPSAQVLAVVARETTRSA